MGIIGKAASSIGAIERKKSVTRLVNLCTSCGGTDHSVNTAFQDKMANKVKQALVQQERRTYGVQLATDLWKWPQSPQLAQAATRTNASRCQKTHPLCHADV